MADVERDCLPGRSLDGVELRDTRRPSRGEFVADGSYSGRRLRSTTLITYFLYGPTGKGNAGRYTDPSRDVKLHGRKLHISVTPVFVYTTVFGNLCPVPESCADAPSETCGPSRWPLLSAANRGCRCPPASRCGSRADALRSAAPLRGPAGALIRWFFVCDEESGECPALIGSNANRRMAAGA